MSLNKYLERIKLINHLILTKATGNIKSLSKKLDLSRGGTYKFINELKELGIPIAYSRQDKCFYYKVDGKIVDNLFEKEMDETELKKTRGGQGFFNIFSVYTYS